MVQRDSIDPILCRDLPAVFYSNKHSSVFLVSTSPQRKGYTNRSCLLPCNACRVSNSEQLRTTSYIQKKTNFFTSQEERAIFRDELYLFCRNRMGVRSSSFMNLLMTIALSLGRKMEMANWTQHIPVLSLGELPVHLVNIHSFSLILRNGVKMSRKRHHRIRAKNWNCRNRIVICCAPADFIELDFLHQVVSVDVRVLDSVEIPVDEADGLRREFQQMRQVAKSIAGAKKPLRSRPLRQSGVEAPGAGVHHYSLRRRSAIDGYASRSRRGASECSGRSNEVDR